MAIFRWGGRKALKCFRQGKLAADRDDRDLAFSWFSEAIRIDPGQSLGYFGRGFIHLKKAEYDQAIADFSAALRLCPGDPMTYFFRGLSYEGKGDEARRGADHEQALILDPDLNRYIAAFWNSSTHGETLNYQLTADGPPNSSASIRGGHAREKEQP